MQKAPLAATYRLKKGYLWCADKKQWISPKVRVPKGMVGAPAFLVVQKSPSGIATCRICGKLIARNEYRFAWPMTDPRGQYGAISAWLHSECANVLVPQMFQKWQKLEKLGWPEYELNEDDDQPADEGRQEEASARVKQEGEAEEDAEQMKELKKEVNEGSGVVLVPEENVDCTSSMTLELWLEIYCAHWSELTTADADLKTKLLSHIQMPITNGVDENENLAGGSHHIVCQLTPIEKVPGMECRLLQFQKEGIAWMVHQESNVRTFGGILADEMGMGKTIQTIGCILYNRVYGTGHAKRGNSTAWLYPAAHPLSEVNAQRRAHQEELKNKLDQEEAEELEEFRIKKEAADSAAAAAASQSPVAAHESPPVQAKGKARVARPKPSPKKKSAPAPRLTVKERMEIAAAKKSALSTSDKCRIDEAPDVHTEGATLVIAPLAAVLQWQSELNKFASELNVLIYHGPNRHLLSEELERADVVITTYPTIEADYRAVVSKHKLKCPYCSKMFLPQKLRLHLRDMCGPDAVRTAKQALRERKQESTKAKAMESLHIGTSTVPTVSNIYREIMHTAGRDKEAADFSGAAWLRPIRRRKITNDEDSSGGGEVDEEEAGADHPELPRRMEEGSHNQAAPSSTSSRPESAESSDDDWLSATHLFKDASGRSADDTDEDDDEGGALRRDYDERLLGTPRVVKRLQQELRASPPDSSKTREIDESICSMKEIEGEEAVPVAPTAQTSIKTEHASTAPAITKTDCDDQLPPNQSQSAPQLTPVKNQDCKKRRAGKSQTGAASSARLISAPPASPLIVPAPANYGQWAETATESQIRRSRVDTLKAVLETLNLPPREGDGANPTRKADLVQRLLDWRAETNKGSTAMCSVTKKSRPNPKNDDALVKSPPRLQPPPPPAAVAERSRSSSPASSSSDEVGMDSSSSLLESSSSSGAPLPTSTSSDESLSDIVVPDASSPSPEDSSVSSYAESDVSSPPGPSKANYFARFGSKKGGKKGTGKKGGKKGVGRKSQGRVSTISQASSLASDGASSVDMNFIDLSSSPLHSLKWNRIVLDEAHRIKSHTTNTCKSVFALKSCGTRWCLTGTPLQNRIHELYSLLRFLQFFPYAYYFCSKKDCACSTLNYSFEGGSYCVTCGHTKMNHFSYFNRKIAKPIISYGVHGEGGLALEVLRRDVLSMILLRRTKVERAADVNLPPLDVFIRREELSQPEMDFYESLYKQSKTKFDTYTLAGTILHNFAHVFDLLSRLRQAVDHPYMIIHGSLATNSQIPSNSHSSNEICGICQEDIERTNYYKSSCDHHFDITCLDEYILEAPSDTKLGCPVCYQSLTYTLFNKITNKPVIRGEEEESSSPITLDDDNLRSNSGLPTAQQALSRQKSNIMSRINPREFQTSTKIEVLLQEIQNSEADSKAIVFSQFTSFLYLIDFKLKKSGFKCAVFTGSLSMESRQNIIMNFNTDPDLKVILISLKAGGEGLNLQIANQIYLMDPWWNPAAEMQAIQRAHRIGQTKHVRAVRIIAKNTIEERILQLQERKQLVFDGTVNNSNQAFQKLSADDLKFLFQ